MGQWSGILPLMGTVLLLTCPRMTSAQDYALRSEPLAMYVDAFLNDYHVFVDHALFFSQMPEVIGYSELDSTRKAQLKDRLVFMADATKNDGLLHLELDQEWKPLFERLLGNNLKETGKIYIVEKGSGQAVTHIWYTRKMKTSHGPGRFRYFTDKDHKNHVFTLNIPGGGGHPLDKF